MKAVNISPGLKVNQSTCVNLGCIKMAFTAFVFFILRLSKSILRDKQYKQKASPQSYKTERKILANPCLALSSFEQHGPD